MKKEIKNFGKWVEIILIVLTAISLVICALEYTNIIYSDSFDTMTLNNMLISKPFTVILWVNNISIILVSIFYIIDTIEQKKNLFLKLSFCFFSICTTMIMSCFIINCVAKIFSII